MNIEGKASRDAFIQSSPVRHTYVITDTSLDIVSELPKSAVIGSEFSGALRIINRSTQQQNDILVSLDIPNGLRLNFVAPLSREFSIPRLEPHEEYSVPIRGTFTKTSNHASSLGVTLLRLDQNASIIQRQLELPITLEKSALLITISPVKKISSLKPGGKTPFVLTWKNISSAELSDVQLGIESAGFGLTEGSLRSATAIHAKPYQLLWTKNQLGDLKLVPPNAQGTIPFDVAPATLHETLTLKADTSLESLFYSFGKYTKEGARISFNGGILELPVDTQVHLGATLRYFSPEGDQIGRGPLPPKIGKATRFYVYVDASSSIHPLDNAAFTATLPIDVSISQSIPTEYGTVDFNTDTRMLTWTIGILPAQIAQQSKRVGAVIELRYIPSGSSTPSMPILVKPRLVGIDTITKTPIEATIEDLTIRNLTHK